jgi:DNA-binding beta-propeller fold protein YncE
LSRVAVSQSLSPAARLTLAAGALLSLSLAGCGNTYRPVVTGSNPVGPPAQPTKYAIAVANPCGPPVPVPTCTTPALLTFVNVFGDTVISTPSVQPNPNYFAISSGGGEGYTTNALGQLDEFGAGNPAGLITSDIGQTTLGTTPATITPVSLNGSNGASAYITQPATSSIAAVNTSNQLIQNIAVPASPLYVVGADGTSRIYSLNSNGTASSIEGSSSALLSVTANITVGTNPTYGVMTSDTRRAFVLNTGSQSVSVINVVNNALDAGISGASSGGACPTPTVVPGTIYLPNVMDSTCTPIASAANPIWADFNPLYSELVVLSQGDGVLPGVVTVINIPLCSAIAQPSNPNCDTNNPVDAAGFGTILKSIPVGINPLMLSVLQDTATPRVYVANSGTSTAGGSVSVVNLNSFTVTATLPTVADSNNPVSTAVFGLRPATIAATTGNPTGKVFVTSIDSRYLTVINTESDTVTTHIPLQGNGLRVVVSTP